MFKKLGLAVLIGLVVAATMMVWTPADVAATSSTNASGDLATGTTTGTGAAINVSLGWAPKVVIVSNPSTTNITSMKWHTDMGAAKGLKTLESATAANIVSYVTVSGISSYAGTSSAGKGFTIGTDTDLNISGDTLYYEAYR